MQNDLILLQPQVQSDITAAVDTSVSVFEETMRGMDTREKAFYVRDQMQALQSLTAKITQVMLYYAWRVLSDSLWTIPLREDEEGNPVHYDSFRDWVDNEIAPSFKKRGKEGRELSYMADIVRICERTLLYAMRHPVKDTKGVPITPVRLIEDVGFSKLKITSSDFIDLERRPERDQELVDVVTLPVSQIKSKYTTPRIPAIKYGLNFNATGETDIIMVGLSANQVGVFKSALGRMITEYAMHISSADREALLMFLLPMDARKQDEQQKEDVDTATE